MDTQAYYVGTPLLAEAAAEARRFGHSFLAPEHLLLAVAEHGAGATRSFLARHGLTAQALRDAVAVVLGPTLAGAAPDGPPTIALRSIVALGHAIGSGGEHAAKSAAYTPDDLLLALLADDVAPHAVVGEIFARVGLTPAAARAELRALASGEAAT